MKFIYNSYIKNRNYGTINFKITLKLKYDKNDKKLLKVWRKIRIL